MKRIVFALLLSSLLLFISCNGTITNPDSSTTIDRIPVFSSSSTVISGNRAIVPNNMSEEDLVYASVAPPITRFENSSEQTNIGDSIEVNIFSNLVTLDSSITEDGMIKLAGVIIEEDGKGEELETGVIEIIYDKENSKFSCYSEILIGNKINEDNFIQRFIIQEIPFTKIDDNNSFLAKFKTLAYIKHCSDSVDIQLVENGELYSGPHNENDWIVGFAFNSFKSLQSKDVDNPILNINSDDPGILVNDEGILNDASLFKNIREQIVEAKDDLFEYGDFLDSPVIGYKIIRSDGSYNQNISIEQKSNINKLKSGIPNADWRSRTTL